MDIHEHIKEFWPKNFAIAHYEKHIAWCRCKIAVHEERKCSHHMQIIAWYQKQIDKCLERIADYEVA